MLPLVAQHHTGAAQTYREGTWGMSTNGYPSTYPTSTLWSYVGHRVRPLAPGTQDDVRDERLNHSVDSWESGRHSTSS